MFTHLQVFRYTLNFYFDCLITEIFLLTQAITRMSRSFPFSSLLNLPPFFYFYCFFFFFGRIFNEFNFIWIQFFFYKSLAQRHYNSNDINGNPVKRKLLDFATQRKLPFVFILQAFFIAGAAVSSKKTFYTLFLWENKKKENRRGAERGEGISFLRAWKIFSPCFSFFLSQKIKFFFLFFIFFNTSIIKILFKINKAVTHFI